MLENKEKTALSELGEFGLIKHLTEHVEITNKSTIRGIGDDAAVIDYEGKNTVITTDMLVEGIHFDLMYMPLKHLGYKAAVVNFSDICAMNALPKQLIVSIAVSSKFSVEAVEELYSGILSACNVYKVDLVGGDTVSSFSGLVINATAVGGVEPKDLVYRNTAGENDLLCVSGNLGAAYLGLQLLEREKQIFEENPNIQPDLGGNDYVLERQLKPEARTDIIKLFKELKIKPSSMIDISDGLASEIIHLCVDSKVGCDLYEDKIPIDSTTDSIATSFNLDPTICALNGGEDYELLFTIKQSDYDKIKENSLITVIGHITDESSGMHMLGKSGGSVKLTAQGWDAFLRNQDKSTGQ